MLLINFFIFCKKPVVLYFFRYKIVDFFGSGQFSRAIQCLDLWTDAMVCVKVIKKSKDYVDQSLDEIKILRLLNANGDPDQNSVLKLLDFFYFKEQLIIVTEMLRDNLYEFSRHDRELTINLNPYVEEEPQYFSIGHVQRIAHQLLKALSFIHSVDLVHSDLKPENILIKSYSNVEVKVIDFGSSCFTTDDTTKCSYVQSRAYRAPEVILGLRWDGKIDIWSLGCVLFEIWTGNVLFENDSVNELLCRIVAILGPFPCDFINRAYDSNMEPKPVRYFSWLSKNRKHFLKRAMDGV